jgi:hypothetical protein
VKPSKPIIAGLVVVLLVSRAHAEYRTVLIQVKRGNDKSAAVTIYSDEKTERRSAASIAEAVKVINSMAGWGSKVGVYVVSDRALPRAGLHKLLRAIHDNHWLDLEYFGRDVPKVVGDHFLAGPSEKDGHKITLANGLGFYTLTSPDIFRLNWESLSAKRKMKGKVSDHLTKEHIAAVIMLEVKLAVPGDEYLRSHLFSFMAEGNRFHTGRLPEDFGKHHPPKFIVALLRTKDGHYGLITHYGEYAVIELNGLIGLASAEVADKARKRPAPGQSWNPALLEGGFMFADSEAFQKYLLTADAVAVAKLTQWDGDKGSVRITQILRGKLKKDVAFLGAGGLLKASAGDQVVVVFKAEKGGMRLHSFCGAPGIYKHSSELEKLVKQLLAVPPGGKPAQSRPATDPITPEMRQALARIAKVHAGIAAAVIDEAVEALHGEIRRHDPKVFVPLAIPYLMRLAPRDTQTRIVLRRALANGWMEVEFTRACLVQAGDTPEPHLKALVKALDAPDAKVRTRAIWALGATGAAGAPALPKLREIVANARADPADFKRAYTARDEMPEHVAADVAIRRIESDLSGRTNVKLP